MRALPWPGSSDLHLRHHQAGRSLRVKPRFDFARIRRAGQFQFHHFSLACDADGQRGWKRQFGFGMKSLAHPQHQTRSTHQPFHRPRQIAVADPAQIALLAEAQAQTLAVGQWRDGESGYTSVTFCESVVTVRQRTACGTSFFNSSFK